MNITKFDKINETLYHYVHPTGVNVYMVSKPGFAKFSASFSTHFGSIDNTFVPIGKEEMIVVPDGVEKLALNFAKPGFETIYTLTPVGCT